MEERLVRVGLACSERECDYENEVEDEGDGEGKG